MSLWTEKYRPATPADLNCPHHIKSFLSSAIENDFPHLLLYGPPGCGKTSFASMLSPTLILNASDDRGIDIVRNKIKKMANTVARQVILLDECENLTRDAQTCLRRVLEDYPTTRFIFCTNYQSKIIGPLKSRLLKIRFSATSGVLEKVGRSEGLDFSQKFYDEVFEKCGVDLRRCLNVLQGVKPLGEFELDDVIGVIREEFITDFWEVKEWQKYVERFIFEGYSVLQLVRQLSLEMRVKGEREKAEMAKLLAECEYKCIIRCSEEVVLSYLIVSYLEMIS